MYGLSESLRANVRLTVLDLSENVIGPKGARYVSEALMKNTTLQSINFEWTGLEAEGINYLITAMKTNTSSSITSLGGLGKKRKKDLFLLGWFPLFPSLPSWRRDGLFTGIRFVAHRFLL